MLQITPQHKILIAIEPADFRCGIDGLAGICINKLKQDPLSGYIFVFRNKSRKAVKILVYDGQGFWLCAKRLSKGKFKYWPASKQQLKVSAANEILTLLYNGDPVTANFNPEWKQVKQPAFLPQS